MADETPGPALAPSCYISYEFRDIIKALHDAQKNIPGAQLLIKFRSPQTLAKYGPYFREVFGDADIAMVYGDLFSFVLLSDFVYCCFSTGAGEVLMARKPMILFPLEEGDDYFYELMRGGAFIVPFPSEKEGIPTEEVVRISRQLIEDPVFYKEAVQKTEQFLKENYVFTGDSSQRVADFLRHVSLPPGN
jgi:hypothetical protein